MCCFGEAGTLKKGDVGVRKFLATAGYERVRPCRFSMTYPHTLVSRDNSPVKALRQRHRAGRGRVGGMMRGAACVLFGCIGGFALDPAHSIAQYAHTAWTRKEAHGPSNIFALTQTPE